MDCPELKGVTTFGRNGAFVQRTSLSGKKDVYGCFTDKTLSWLTSLADVMTMRNAVLMVSRRRGNCALVQREYTSGR